MDIFIFRDGKQWGPFQEVEVLNYLAAGNFSASDPAWREGLSDWIPLSDLVGKKNTPPPPPLVASNPSALQDTPVPLTNRTDMESILWNGHPTLWHWWAAIFIGIVTIPLIIGLLILLRVFITCFSTQYTVTNKRISIKTGVFSKSSRELRIRDIRSIAVRKNIFGVGSIEFSTAARDAAEVIFTGIWDADKIQTLIKGIQD